MQDTFDSLKSQAEKQTQSRNLVKGSYLKTGYKIKVYENSLYFENDVDRQHREKFYVSSRGDVKTFSASSRKRLLRIFSRIQISCYQKMYFVTLTYHEAWREASFAPASDLNVFLQSLRDKYDNFDYIWRLEFQKRGAPHYHLIIMFRKERSVPTYANFLKYCISSWHRTADPDSKDHAAYGVTGAPLNDYRQAFSYCSKYSAKEETPNGCEYSGRRWGTSVGLALRPVLSLELPYAMYMQIRELARMFMMQRGKISAKFIQYLSDPYTCHTYIQFDDFVEFYDKVFKFATKKRWKNIMECLWIYDHWEPRELYYLQLKSHDLSKAQPPRKGRAPRV